MKYSGKYILSVLSIIFIFGCDSKTSKGEQVTIVTLDNNLDAQDRKIFKSIQDNIKLIVGESTKLNDPDLINTSEKMSVNADISMEEFSNKQYLDAQNIIETKLNGRLIQDNGKGALIYCLGNHKTFEIHKPLVISKQYYDMNDISENRGVFKIIQLRNDWNINMTVYKTGYEQCR